MSYPSKEKLFIRDLRQALVFSLQSGVRWKMVLTAFQVPYFIEPLLITSYWFPSIATRV